MKKILITGGLGFLGSRISEFLSRDYQIFISTREKSFKKKIQVGGKFIKIVTIDWQNESSLLKLLKNIDVVIHCAGIDASQSNIDFVQTFNINVLNTINLSKAAEKSRVEKIIFISTIQVYGQELRGIIDEYSPTFPLSYYAISKKTAEDLLIASNFTNVFTKSYIVRLSNCFGYPADFCTKNINLMIFDFCRQAIYNSEICVNSNSNFVKNYISAQSFCEQIEKIVSLEEAENDSFILNLGGETISLLELLNRISVILKQEGILLKGFRFSDSFDHESGEHFLYSSENFKLSSTKANTNYFDNEISGILKFISKRKYDLNEH